MDINSLGSLGELIAALATVLTLIYLSAQIRQTNLITKARFGHEITQRLSLIHISEPTRPRLIAEAV